MTKEELDEIDVAMTLADPGHPIWKAILSLVALLTVLWTQTNVI